MNIHPLQTVKDTRDHVEAPGIGSKCKDRLEAEYGPYTGYGEIEYAELEEELQQEAWRLANNLN